MSVLLLTVTGPLSAQSPDAEARRLAPWLDVPAEWLRNVENGVVGVMPNDLPTGTSLILLVEPLSVSSESLPEAYDRAVRDLGSWRPVGEPLQQEMLNGWAFRHGVGVVTLNGTNFTGHTAVARAGDQLVRIWALADSDVTYNRYKHAIATAIASTQDIPTDVAATPAPADDRARVASSAVVADFGSGVSGVYVGVERGATASAGVGPTGAPQLVSQIGDYEEVDVFFPDGTHRRRLPVRGLASDLYWERRQQAALWGTWTQDGDRITVRRGNYTTTYTLDGEMLVSDRDRPWAKLVMPADSRLDGVYTRADYRDADAPRLVLRSDGSYEDRGGFLRMIGSAWHLVTPDGETMVERWTDAEARQAMAGGSGTYTFDAFTLTLHDRDGRVWQINAYVPAGETFPRPRRLVINGRALARE